MGTIRPSVLLQQTVTSFLNLSLALKPQSLFQFIMELNSLSSGRENQSSCSQNSFRSFENEEEYIEAQEDTEEAFDEEDNEMREDEATSPPKVFNNSKRNLLVSLFTLFVAFISLSLTLDYFLYSRIEMDIKTIDAVLGHDNPDADIHLSVKVSTPMVFSSIKINSFDCEASHKAPHDDSNLYFAKVASLNSFVTPTMLEVGRNTKHFTQDLDIALSDIDFGVLKRAVQDISLSTKASVTRLECALKTDVTFFGVLSVSLPTQKKVFKKDCSQCVTTTDFDSTDMFITAMVGSLLLQENTSPSGLRPGEENHQRSVSFSENADEFVFSLDKQVDVSKHLSAMERFTIEVPSSAYVVYAPDKAEYWQTTTTPFSVDLANPEGATVRMDITTTCTDASSEMPCHLATPLQNFLDDVWGGQVNYKVSSAPSSAGALSEIKAARMASAGDVHSSMRRRRRRRISLKPFLALI